MVATQNIFSMFTPNFGEDERIPHFDLRIFFQRGLKLNHQQPMHDNSSSRPLDPVTEVGRLVTAVPQLAALAIVASWC